MSCSQSFRTAAQAEAFRARLTAFAHRGEPFRLDTGRPASRERPANEISWFDFTLKYVDARWARLSPNSRRGEAEALVDVTEVMVTKSTGPGRDDRRAALQWAYITRVRDPTEPADLAATLRWLRNNTIQMTEFTDRVRSAHLIRAALTRLSQKKSGAPAAPNTTNRKRMVLHNAMEFGVEAGVLTQNPMSLVKWTRPRTVASIDPRVVINTEQARRFLAAVDAQGERGKRMKAFFATLYYAGLRPEEAAELRRDTSHASRRHLACGERFTSPTPNHAPAADGPTLGTCANRHR